MELPIFKHPAVRDLAWAGFSPPLLTGALFQDCGLRTGNWWPEHLADLDRDPESLLEFLGERPAGRLGLYYERLWQYLLTHDPDIELLANNLAVRDQGRTIGEFDCLLWSARLERHIHLELAVKFYLGVTGTGRWLGPNVRDRFDLKLDHLIQRQITLSRHPAAQDALKDLGISNCEQRIDLKGYLFAPSAGIAPPDGFNPASQLHHWLTLSAFQEHKGSASEHWHHLPRHRWLGPHWAGGTQPLSREQVAVLVQEEIARLGRPQQVVACDASGRERERWFVTPDDWPIAATEALAELA